MTYTETSLLPDQAALVANGVTGGIKILLPPSRSDDDEALPDCVAFLLACALRFHLDYEFVEEQLDWIDRHADLIK